MFGPLQRTSPRPSLEVDLTLYVWGVVSLSRCEYAFLNRNSAQRQWILHVDVCVHLAVDDEMVLNFDFIARADLTGFLLSRGICMSSSLDVYLCVLS